jgi:hypothetical protein
LAVVQKSRQNVVEVLRRAGFREAAEQAAKELPDPVDVEHAVAWGMQRGITREVLMTQLGGSP